MIIDRAGAGIKRSGRALLERVRKTREEQAEIILEHAAPRSVVVNSPRVRRSIASLPGFPRSHTVYRRDRCSPRRRTERQPAATAGVAVPQWASRR